MKSFSNLFLCPKCKSVLNILDNKYFCSDQYCSNSKVEFPFFNNVPALVDFDNSIIDYEQIVHNNSSSFIYRNKPSKFKKAIRTILNGSNIKSKNNFVTCLGLLQNLENPRVLIVGGGTIGVGSELIIEKFKNDVISFDVYYSPTIDFIADAHSIPLSNACIDLVIIQAVLEHVLDPAVVVSECYRVLKSKGYIYAETPFLQHVHEGAYDFTRYTNLGHRIMFKDFTELSSGYIGGMGQSLLWSIDYFFSGLFRSRYIGKIFKILFLWLRVLEKMIPDKWNIDGACGSYFLGQKRSTNHNKLKEFIREYKGAQG
jgi:SAM-dependent methyltransferase